MKSFYVLFNDASHPNPLAQQIWNYTLADLNNILETQT